MEMETAIHDEIFMRRCLELARKGRGKTGMNPLVGSVIVHEGQIIGEGYHMKYGGAHAEVNAIQSVKDQGLLPFSTLYVNLEPCSHFGKTPPCSLLIREKKIPRVVVGIKDPNPLVSGKGLEFLKKAGVKIQVGMLSKESKHLNRRFLTNTIKKRPYVILKWAESKDGFIDKIRDPESPAEPTWISNFSSRKLVHKWRGTEDGIFAGVNTIIADDPELNLREWSGKQGVRVSIDRHNRIMDHHKIKNGKVETIIFTLEEGENKNVLYKKIESDFDLESMLLFLYSRDIGSLIIEGGKKIFNSFIDSGLWDEARVFKGSILFKDGIKSPKLPVDPTEKLMFGNNMLHISYNTDNKEKGI